MSSHLPVGSPETGRTRVSFEDVPDRLLRRVTNFRLVSKTSSVSRSIYNIKVTSVSFLEITCVVFKSSVIKHCLSSVESLFLARDLDSNI